MSMSRLILAGPLGLVLLIAGCAGLAPSPVSDNPAVVALVDEAHTSLLESHHANAAASLERALRIEPRNARLWQELAQVRLAEGDFAQAESLAARSNAWAGSDNRLRAENWRLIAEARARRGDSAGEKAALDRAGRHER